MGARSEGAMGTAAKRPLRWWPVQGVAVVVPLVPAAVNCVNGVFTWVGPRGAIASWFAENGWFVRPLWLSLDLLAGVGGASGLVLAAVLLRTRRLVLGSVGLLLLAAVAGVVSGATTWNEGERAFQAFESAFQAAIFPDTNAVVPDYENGVVGLVRPFESPPLRHDEGVPLLFNAMLAGGIGISPLWYSAAFTVSALLLLLAYGGGRMRRPYRTVVASVVTVAVVAFVPVSDQQPGRFTTASDCDDMNFDEGSGGGSSAESGLNPNSDAGASADSGTGTNSDARTNSDAGAEASTGTDAGTGTGTDAGAGVDPGWGSGVGAGEMRFVCGVRGSEEPPFGKYMPDDRLIAYGRRLCDVYTRGDLAEAAAFRSAYGVAPLDQAAYLQDLCPKADADLDKAAADDEAEMLAWEAEAQAMCDRAPRHRPLIDPVRATREKEPVWPEFWLEAYEKEGMPQDGLYEQEVDLVAVAPGHLLIGVDTTYRVCVTTETYDRRPPVETKGWDHVVEIGYESPAGRIELIDDLSGAGLPDLSLRGRKGHYRIRVHYDPPDWEKRVGQRLLVMAWPGRGDDRVVHRAPQR
ncbi:hypothetical protein GCM10009850_051270 [Nonomuraea monospora]|uniref:Uncharacterized protein n=2 Tax=Nonomuraea monospora TaxID=568818 RepID=A0ABN3CKF6_9ACTN